VSSELARVGGSDPVGLVRPPEETLSSAGAAATALMGIISKKPKKLMFNGEQYLEVDDWETIGAFHGCTADVVWSREITLEIADKDGNAIRGWEARAVLLDRTGRELTHADAMCLSDEAKWSERPKYAWVYVLKDGTTSEEDPGAANIEWVPNPNKPDGVMPKKVRQLVGSEAPPEFQMRSMAQTRAVAKAHSNVFRWVARLAGCAGTPADELPDIETVDRETGEVTTKAPAAARPAAARPAAQPAKQCPEVRDGQQCRRVEGHTKTEHVFDKVADTAVPPPAVPPPAAPAHTVAQPPVTVKDITSRSGTKAGKPWTVWTVVFSDKVQTVGPDAQTTDRAGTFSETIAGAADNARAAGVNCYPKITSEKNGRGYVDHNITALPTDS